MPRFVLIDAELDCVAGDTSRFFVTFLRVCAYARGEDLDSEAVHRLTPARAAEVLDIMEGDTIGWRYIEHLNNWPVGTAGYEVYAMPPRIDDFPPIACTSDEAVVRRVRSTLRPVAFVEKVLMAFLPALTRDPGPELAAFA